MTENKERKREKEKERRIADYSIAINIVTKTLTITRKDSVIQTAKHNQNQIGYTPFQRYDYKIVYEKRYDSICQAMEDTDNVLDILEEIKFPNSVIEEPKTDTHIHTPKHVRCPKCGNELIDSDIAILKVRRLQLDNLSEIDTNTRYACPFCHTTFIIENEIGNGKGEAFE